MKNLWFRITHYSVLITQSLRAVLNSHGRIQPLLVSALVLFVLLLPFTLRPQSSSLSPDVLPGQSTTYLPDGRLLLIGGEGPDGAPVGTVSLYDPSSGTISVLGTQSSSLSRPRAYHSATMLPDGTVFIFGGKGSDSQVLSSPELFDPNTSSFSLLSPQSSALSPALAPRSNHTATLLTDGRILIAGGLGSNGQVLDFAELVDLPQSAIRISQSAIRIGGTASLLPDGTVLLSGGQDDTGTAVAENDLFDPVTQSFQLLPDACCLLPSGVPQLEASLPLDGAVDVAVDAVIALRFSKPLRVDTVNTDTATLSGPAGIEQITVIPAEGGTLAFITPQIPLLSGATYTVTLNGPIDRDGFLLPLSGFSFTTQSSSLSPQSSPSSTQSSSSTSQPTATTEPSAVSDQPSDTSTQAASQPADSDWEGEWRDGKPYSPWQDLPPLQANPGITALAGQVLDLKGEPLANVTLKVEYDSYDIAASTDDSGRFLLKNITPGWRELIIDGRLAGPNRKSKIKSSESEIGNPKSAIQNRQWGYGVFKAGLEVKAGETNILAFTIWLPKIDTAQAVTIPSPTTQEVVITTPKIPGLELRIPAGTVIYDYQGNVVTEVSITPIPVDRPPFPLAKDVEVPLYFTAQPGGSYIYSTSGTGVRLIYPNAADKLPGTRFHFWHYDPDYRGWYIYGLGTVTEDGKQIIPDPGISVYEFTGAMVAPPGLGPPEGPEPDCDDDYDNCPDPEGGDPVDLGTGLLVVRKTDLFLPDVLPIKFTRTYRTRDTFSRAFGLGTSHAYDMFIVGDTFPYTFAEIVLPDGGRIRYIRTSPGTSFAEAVYEHRAPDASCPTCVGTPTRFYGSKIIWNGNGYDLHFRDGTVYTFEEGFQASRPGQAGLIAIRDRNSNALTITRDSNGNVTKITSPNGRWIEFTNDSSNRITQAKDNIGRTVTYTYDASGRLASVTDPEGGVTTYTYDASHRMLTIQDARGIVFLNNEYDANGRVIKQTQADGSIYQFAYTLDANGKVTQTDVTDPRGNLRRVAFNGDGRILTDTRAFGTPEAQTFTYEREAGTNLVLSVTDALNRKTAYTYDTMGNVTSITRLAETPQAVTTSFTYEPIFNQAASITNPLGNTTSFAYDEKGNLTTVTDPLGNQTTFGYNEVGQPVSVTDALGNTSQFTYDFGDLVSVSDPLGNSTNRFIDAAGRLLSLRNPLDQLTRYDYDDLNRLTQVTDPLAGITAFGYDLNGNLLSVTDARSSVTSYTYDNMDRLATRTDPLLRGESYQYDLAANLTQFTDRKGQVTTFQYDALNRRTFAGFGAIAGNPPTYESTITYTYDAGNRLTQIVDSISGTITRTYDGLDRLTSETTPQGSVTYTYDAAGRRTSMTVAGQSTVFYTYDNANRLTQITQGTSTVSFAYDLASRRTSLTLPNGILVEYAYDAASRVTAITYKLGTTVLGDLTYTYDTAGNRTKIGGTFARTGIPQAIASSSYNAANQQLALADKTMTYDNNGNLKTLSDASGVTTYSWNARNQLVGISGPGVSASFEYDPFGRRVNKTVNTSVTEFVYDGVNPVQETSGATILANILTGLGIDEVFMRTDAAGGSSFLTDALGSTVALSDSGGTAQAEYTYEPFGGTTASGVSSSNPFQFTGRENDSTGLYYYRNRYYHPGLQRFLSEDPIGFHGGDVNLYAYVANSPAVYADPWGLTHAGRLGGHRRLRDACRIPGNCFPQPPPPGGGRKDQPPEPPKPPEPPITPQQKCEFCIEVLGMDRPQGYYTCLGQVCVPGDDEEEVEPNPRHPNAPDPGVIKDIVTDLIQTITKGLRHTD